MKRPFYFTIVIIVLLSLFEIVPIRSAQAGNEQLVMNANDSGVGSLRQAIVAASNGDIITFDPSLSGQTIHLASELAVDKSITIDGSNLPSSITISGDTDDDGDGDVQLMTIASFADVTIHSIGFTKGYPITQLKSGGINNLGSLTIIESSFFENTGHQGGAIRNSGNLTVDRIDFTANSAPDGGAILNDLNATAIITSSTFTQNSTTYGNGGAIENIGNLTVNDSLFTQNTAGDGGGISNQGTMTTTNSTFSSNSADFGGGIVNFGILTVTKSNLSLNSGSNGGGGIMNFHTGILTVEDSTISNNSAGNGGGIFNFNIATITNSTISENSASTNGGGISTWFSLNLTNSTVVGNEAETGGGVFNLGTLTTTNVSLSENAAIIGGGVYNSFVTPTPGFAGEFNYSNTIIANSTSGADCYNDGVINTNTNNLVENNAASPNQCSTPFLSEDPKLGLLKNNGGFTQTLELLPSSPAIDAGNDAICASAPVSNASQNGITRPRGSHCDIGAYEHSSIIIVTNTNDNGPGSLRQIIADAYSNFTVTFDPSLAGQTIHLASELVVDKSITIDGSSLTPHIQISGDSDNDGDGDVQIIKVSSTGNLTIKNLAFTKGYTFSSTQSGGIENFGQLTVIDSKFYYNAGGQGGAIRNSGTLMVTNTIFEYNTAIEGGGAIFNHYTSNTSTTTINNCSFIQNTATAQFSNLEYAGAGGAIASTGPLMISESEFVENSAFLGAGAILAGGDTTISDTNFSSNTAGLEGGGAILSWKTTIVENSLFNSNTASGYGASGGAIKHPTNGSITISQSTFSDNTASGGGAISLGAQMDYPLPAVSPTLSILNTVISNNHADFGGGLLILSGTTTIKNTTISENSSEDTGGIVNSTLGNLTIINSTVNNNFSNNTNSPAGILTQGPTNIINSTIANNLGPAIQSYGETNIINSTIAGNMAYGIRHYSGVLVLKNSILANNWWDCTLETGGVVGENQNNLIEENFCGIASLDSDPNLGPLAENGGSTQTMALLSGSPAIDAGDDATCASAPVSNTSQNGVTRPQGEHCDIGAFEYSTPLPDLIITNVTINPTVPLPNQTFEVSITIKNQGGTGSANTVFRDVYINRDPSTLIDPTTGCPPPGDFFRSDSYISIPAGMTDTKTVTITGGLPSGNHQFWFYVDSRCLVDEGGGSNSVP